MPEPEVLYSDVKFKKSKDKVNETGSPSEDTTYSEVKITKSPQPSSELPGSQQQAASQGRTGFTWERAAVVVLSVLLVILAAALAYIIQTNVTQKAKIVKQNNDYEALKRNYTAEKKCEGTPCIPLPKPTCPDLGPCPKCEEGWELFGEKCYYFSTNNSTWSESRADCQQRGSAGGDLVKIDSREEQAIFDQGLRDKMTESEDKFWIGLTDSETEGTWLWVDGSPLDSSLTFWSKGEPDDWKVENLEGEDCVRIGENGGDVALWYTKSCEVPHKYICEKPAERGQMKCI